MFIFALTRKQHTRSEKNVTRLHTLSKERPMKVSLGV